MSHIHELIDFAVGAYITYNNKVLLVLHKKLHRWLPIGGHIELNEDPEEALFREIKEECGLEIEVIGKKEPHIKVKGTKFLYPPTFMNIHDINESHKHIGLVYFAKATSDKFIYNKEEHDNIRWFSEEDLNNSDFNLNEDIKFYAKEALKKYGI